MKEKYNKMKSYMKVLRKHQVFCMALSLFSVGSINIVIIMMQRLIDTVNNDIPITSTMLLQYGGILVVLFVSGYLFQYYFRKLTVLGVKELKTSLYKELLDEPVTYFDQHNSGEIISLFENDITSLGTVLSSNNIIIFLQSFSFILTLSMLLYYSISLTCIILVLMLICFIATSKLGTKMALVEKEIYERKSSLTSQVNEAIKIIFPIKNLDKEHEFYRNYETKYECELLKSETLSAKYLGVYVSIYSVLSFVLPVIAIGIGVLLIQNGTLTIGSLIAIYALIGQA